MSPKMTFLSKTTYPDRYGNEEVLFDTENVIETIKNKVYNN